MIKSLKATNFRSLKEANLKFAPLTFFYGNNAVGKSSVFYALNILRNVIQNSNVPTDSFFNLNYINLGTFKQVAYKHQQSESMSFSISTKVKNINCNFKLVLKFNSGELNLEIPEYDLKLSLPVTFPYPSNQQVQSNFTFKGKNYSATWNGLVAQVTPEVIDPESGEVAKTATLAINGLAEKIRKIDVIPLKRGFTRPTYGIIGEGFLTNEDEVASKLAVDAYLDASVSHYLEQIMDRQFRVKVAPGQTQASLMTHEKDATESYDLVNDGYGVNQLVYLLAKTLNQSYEVICMEEPEINLHPGVVRKLPEALINIAKETKKQILISTHSESLIIAVLSAVAKGEIRKEDVAFYLTTKNKGITHFEKQEITRDGKVKGGLKSFMTGELEDIKSFLNPVSGQEPEPLNPEFSEENS
ncbi:MAG: AAA family ATPase [Patescibacteria group bacterium]